MKRGILVILMLLAVGTANADAAPEPRWIAFPTCTANTTTLTCSGSAAGVSPLNPAGLPGLGEAVVGLFGAVRYSCSDPVFDFVERGFGTPATGPLASITFHRSQPFAVSYRGMFTISYSPLATPSALMALATCQGDWTRDPNYYEVSVDIGWGLGSALPITALAGPIGTVAVSP